jgi:tetratricopeptide (TPR) repeat protein
MVRPMKLPHALILTALIICSVGITGFVSAPAYAKRAAPADTTAPIPAAPAAPTAQYRLLDAAMKAMEGNLALMKDDKVAGNKAVQEAIVIYDEILQKEPDNVAALNGRGMARNLLADHTGRDDLQKAVQVSTITLTKNSKDALAYHARATAYRALDEYDAARKDYQAAIALMPERSNWPLDLRAMEVEAKMVTKKP